MPLQNASSAAFPCPSGSAIIASTALRRANGCPSLSARCAALRCSPDAAALDRACCAPALNASSLASTSAASAVPSSHKVSFASAPPVARTSPSTSDASAQALSSCASRVATAAPVRTPQSTNNPSLPVLTIWVPWLINRRESTAAVWPSRVRRHEDWTPALGSHDHSLMNLSPPAVAMTRSVGENATAHTPRL